MESLPTPYQLSKVAQVARHVDVIHFCAILDKFLTIEIFIVHWLGLETEREHFDFDVTCTYSERAYRVAPLEQV